MLNHKFIRSAKKTSYLTELIERSRLYSAAVSRSTASETNLDDDHSRFATANSDMWDFGTVKSKDKQAHIGKGSMSYVYSDSSDDGEESNGACKPGTAQHNIHTPINSKSTSLNNHVDTACKAAGMLGSQMHGAQSARQALGLGGSALLSHDTHNEYSDMTIRTGDSLFTNRRDHLVEDKSSTTIGSTQHASDVHSHIIQQNDTFQNILLPVMADLRSQAVGYPVALKSIEKLQKCLLEAEIETSGLVDTFVAKIMARSSQMHYQVRRE